MEVSSFMYLIPCCDMLKLYLRFFTVINSGLINKLYLTTGPLSDD